MILYYVRHGDPIYNPNQLTDLGLRQAEAVGRRLAVHGIDKVYSSPSNRAYQTAQPLCQITKQTATVLDWADEDLAYADLTLFDDDGRKEWVFRHKIGKTQLIKPDVLALGRQWYTHPDFAGTNFGPGIQRIQQETNALLESLGYRHDLEKNCYYALRDNQDRVAFFAHEGVGMAVLSCMLDIPYPLFASHFAMTHTGVTVIHFQEQDGIVLPKVLTYSNDSHLYREGLPTKHQNQIYY